MTRIDGGHVLIGGVVRPLLVVEDAILMCSFGTAPCKFKLGDQDIKSGGPDAVHVKVVPEDDENVKKNAANILDYDSKLNVTGFTMCTSPSNPAVAAALGVPQTCTPMLQFPWFPGKKDTTLRKEPALDSDSKLMCAYAGVITVKDAGEKNAPLPP